MTSKRPAWLTSQIALREAKNYQGKVIRRTLAEHLARCAAIEAAQGRVWSDTQNAWIKA